MPRPLVEHPHALADGEPGARPLLGGALKYAPRLVESIARSSAKLAGLKKLLASA
jgi:hypothetical protein